MVRGSVGDEAGGVDTGDVYGGFHLGVGILVLLFGSCGEFSGVEEHSVQVELVVSVVSCVGLLLICEVMLMHYQGVYFPECGIHDCND